MRAYCRSPEHELNMHMQYAYAYAYACNVSVQQLYSGVPFEALFAYV
jgi:hypothetical protein